jgi:type VI secretion system protein ImpL
MKQMLLKLAKICLILTGFILLLLAVFGITLILDWPWWTGLFILLGLAGLIIGFVFLRKIWLRHREQRFVHQIIDQDDVHLKGLNDKERGRSKELQDQWKEAIETLRRSHLRKRGNPLYVLPWYLVIGESGSGKTTAIKGARLSSPFADFTQTSGISGTKNCDWWFFEQAIIIDTAGRYAIPIDEGRDKDEWLKFLNLLTKYRKKEPLNGLIVTISADKLHEAGPETLKEDGRSIRLRIDELMLALGAKFPVYVLVTKCDLIQGMTQFCDQLPDNALSQAMGFTNQGPSKDAVSFQAHAIDTIGERLRHLRLLLVHHIESKMVDPGLLLFPEEFERLKTGLDSFISGAFQENPYQETPALRGLFFSSGRQEGAPFSHFLNTLGLIDEKEVLPGTNRGLFLHDFFARILPTDRGIFAPTQRALEWNRLTRNLGLTSWVALVIAVCGLLSFSFVKNLRTLREVSREFMKPPVLQGEILSDVVIMDRFLRAILNVEHQNRNWWIPRFGLDESVEVEIGLKEKYCNLFKKGFLAPLDQKMTARMANFSAATPDEAISHHIPHLVRRINLIRTRLGARDMEALQEMPAPPYDALILSADPHMISEVMDKVPSLYLHNLSWNLDLSKLNQEMNDLQRWLKHILVQKNGNLDWLVVWANSQESLSPARLKDFWGGSLSLSEAITVEPAFTRMGKEQINAFLKEMESALPDPGPPMIARQESEFEVGYRKAFLDAWHHFGSNFSKGAERLKVEQERLRVVSRIANNEGPYFTLLERMASELEPIAKEENLPGWADLVFRLQPVKTQADELAYLKDKGALGKAAEKGQQLISKIENKFHRAKKDKTLESHLKTAWSYLDYKNALSEIAPALASRKAAYDTACQVFNEDPATSQAPFFVAHHAVFKLKTYMARGKQDEEIFWALVNGPFDYLWTFVRTETACHLQDLWEKQVLVEIRGVSDRMTANQILLGQDGYALKFMKGPLEPFISRGLRRGYRAKQALDAQIPFEASFLSFLTKGVTWVKLISDNYTVSIEGLPTDINKKAQLKPDATHLEIQCADKIQRLDNYNYPVRKTFDWSPLSCGDVVLQIGFKNFVLNKKYTGYNAFPRFLRDFRTGHRLFFPNEFPDKQAALKRLGIRHIKVKYQFRGHRKVMALLTDASGSIPTDIVKCWDQ